MVEVGDVPTAQGENDVAGEVVASVFPPVREQACSRRDWALGDDEPLAFLGVGEVVAPDSRPDTSECIPFEIVVLAAIFGQDDGAFALNYAGEESACADGW